MLSPNDTEVDFRLDGRPGDTIFALTALSEGAHDWMADHVELDDERLGFTVGGAPGVYIEHRYIGDIVDGLREDGYSIEGEATDGHRD